MELNTDKLHEHVALPDWEKRLLPLFLFKGTQPYRIRALWNVAYAMFLAETDSIYGGRHVVVPDDDHGKLCGILRPPTHMGMLGIIGRLRGSAALTDSVSKAFTEYIEWLHPNPCIYTRVPLETTRFDARSGWWRVPTKAPRKVFKLPEAKPADRAYPYVTGRTPEQNLVAQVYAMVPKSIPHEIRGDLCQDLIVGVLSGETSVENIPNVIRSYAAKARKIMPDRWRNISIDDVMPGTDNMRLIDTLADESEPYEEEEYDL